MKEPDERSVPEIDQLLIIWLVVTLVLTLGSQVIGLVRYRVFAYWDGVLCMSTAVFIAALMGWKTKYPRLLTAMAGWFMLAMMYFAYAVFWAAP